MGGNSSKPYNNNINNLLTNSSNNPGNTILYDEEPKVDPKPITQIYDERILEIIKKYFANISIIDIKPIEEYNSNSKQMVTCFYDYTGAVKNTYNKSKLINTDYTYTIIPEFNNTNKYKAIHFFKKETYINTDKGVNARQYDYFNYNFILINNTDTKQLCITRKNHNGVLSHDPFYIREFNIMFLLINSG